MKVGDKLLCKKDFYEPVYLVEPFFIKRKKVLENGESYVVEKVGVVDNLTVAGLPVFKVMGSTIPKRELHKYFYTKKEIRKLKLERLSNV